MIFLSLSFTSCIGMCQEDLYAWYGIPTLELEAHSTVATRPIRKHNPHHKNDHNANRYGYDTHGYNRHEYDRYGYDRYGYNNQGHHRRDSNRTKKRSKVHHQ